MKKIEKELEDVKREKEDVKREKAVVDEELKRERDANKLQVTEILRLNGELVRIRAEREQAKIELHGLKQRQAAQNRLPMIPPPPGSVYQGSSGLGSNRRA